MGRRWQKERRSGEGGRGADKKRAVKREGLLVPEEPKEEKKADSAKKRRNNMKA